MVFYILDTPRRWYFLHTFCWLLNAFAVFFILAAHEHYTIDVVIAFYISSRLFLYYHTLACAPFFRKSDENRAKIWFPLFWFFESDSSGRRIPHEFEWPFRIGEILTFMKKESDGGKSD
ncbi:MAG: hypothetical protein GY830_01430 [Bacteroidetes bacterium]|nr:hypothetical protein [Bacteroidota bacterium]